MLRVKHERVKVAVPGKRLRSHVGREEYENPHLAIGRAHVRQDRRLCCVVEVGATNILTRPEHQIQACAVKLRTCLKVKRVIG